MGRLHVKAVRANYELRRRARAFVDALAMRLPDADARPRVFMSVETLCRMLGYEGATQAARVCLKRVLGELKRVGVLDVDQRPCRGRAATYWLNPSKDVRPDAARMGVKSDPHSAPVADANRSPLNRVSDPHSSVDTMPLEEDPYGVEEYYSKPATPINPNSGGPTWTGTTSATSAESYQPPLIPNCSTGWLKPAPGAGSPPRKSTQPMRSPRGDGCANSDAPPRKRRRQATMPNHKPAQPPLLPGMDAALQPAAPANPQQMNAGLILRAWIDYLAENGVKLPSRIIGHYAKAIKTCVDDGFDATLIKRALVSMLDGGVADRPALLANHIVRVQSLASTRGPRSTADQRVEAGLALAAQLRAERLRAEAIERREIGA